ncbi:MAG: cyclic nucleotide-binding domain-containing protein [Bryobacteraceae bacterium]|nr:cyclic nucleotide-binding domain-containing protein [Bryobacteraceae bacterium]
MRKALYILSVLEDTDLEWMAHKGSIERVPAQSELISEGQVTASLYFVLDGELAVRAGGADGTEIARLLSGEIVGEMSFVDTRPPSASVVAVQDSLVLALDRALLTRRLEQDSGFAARFYKAIAKFLADRLYVTTGRFGYGSHRQDVDVDQIDDDAMEDVSMASLRFDQFLKRLRSDYRSRSAGVV